MTRGTERKSEAEQSLGEMKRMPMKEDDEVFEVENY